MNPVTPSSSLRLMLISNTGRPVLAHCRDAITDFLGDRRSAAFVTAASLADEARYFEEANDSLVGTGTAGVLDELVHLIWDNPVVALEEGAILRLEDDKIDVSGSAAAKVFTRAQPAQWFAPGSDISAIGHAVASSA